MSIRRLLFALPLLLITCALALSGCQTTSGDAAKDARGRATNAALAEAGKVLGNVAVSALFNVAKQEAGGGKVDYAQAASDAVWKSAGSIVSSGSIERVIEAYSGNKLPETAQTAANVFAGNEAKDPAAVTNAIATVISTAAGAPPATTK